MNIEQILFYVLASLVIGSAMFVVFSGNLVRSLFVFFISLFAIAGLYVFALADFIALSQVVIYVGGVLVLMLFAFLLSNKELLNDLQLIKTKLITVHHFPGILIALMFLIILVLMIREVNVDSLGWIGSVSEKEVIQTSDNTIHQLGILIMTRYLLPFEVISVLLMMALIGAAHLARKGRSQ